MIFGVHNLYNNGANIVGDYAKGEQLSVVPEVGVIIRDQGLVVVYLDWIKTLDLDEKIAFAAALDGVFKQKFGQGISFATCRSSDCLEQGDLVPFYQAIKKINPEAKTFYATGKMWNGEWLSCPRGLQVDFLIESDGDKTKAQAIIESLALSAEQKAAPLEGWERFEKDLSVTVRNVLIDIMQSVPSQKRDSLFESRLLQLQRTQQRPTI